MDGDQKNDSLFNEWNKEKETRNMKKELQSISDVQDVLNSEK